MADEVAADTTTDEAAPDEAAVYAEAQDESPDAGESFGYIEEEATAMSGTKISIISDHGTTPNVTLTAPMEEVKRWAASFACNSVFGREICIHHAAASLSSLGS